MFRLCKEYVEKVCFWYVIKQNFIILLFSIIFLKYELVTMRSAVQVKDILSSINSPILFRTIFLNFHVTQHLTTEVWNPQVCLSVEEEEPLLIYPPFVFQKLKPMPLVIQLTQVEVNPWALFGTIIILCGQSCINWHNVNASMHLFNSVKTAM